MGLFNYNIEKYSPKQLVVIPLVILALSLVSLAITMAMTGMPVTPGIDFSGGTAVTVITTDTKGEIQATFAAYPLIDIGEGVSNGKFIKFGTMADAKYASLTSLIDQRYPNAKID